LVDVFSVLLLIVWVCFYYCDAKIQKKAIKSNIMIAIISNYRKNCVPLQSECGKKQSVAM
jgi:hypothetical protein